MKKLVTVGLMLAGLGLGACSSMSSMFHGRTPPPDTAAITPNVNSNMLGKVPASTPLPAATPQR